MTAPALVSLSGEPPSRALSMDRVCVWLTPHCHAVGKESPHFADEESSFRGVRCPASGHKATGDGDMRRGRRWAPEPPCVRGPRTVATIGNTTPLGRTEGHSCLKRGSQVVLFFMQMSTYSWRCEVSVLLLSFYPTSKSH